MSASEVLLVTHDARLPTLLTNTYISLGGEVLEKARSELNTFELTKACLERNRIAIFILLSEEFPVKVRRYNDLLKCSFINLEDLWGLRTILYLVGLGLRLWAGPSGKEGLAGVF